MIYRGNQVIVIINKNTLLFLHSAETESKRERENMAKRERDTHTQ